MTISKQFIDQLFTNQYFKQSLISFSTLQRVQTPTYKNQDQHGQIQTVIDDIIEVLSNNYKLSIEKQYNHLYESNRYMLQQIQNLKNKVYSSAKVHTESSTAERDTKSKFDTSIFFQCDEQYDMKQIRKNIEDMQDELENKILINSFEVEREQLNLQFRQKGYTQQEIDDKINASIEGSLNRIQLSLQDKFERYSEKVEHRIQQLKRTIVSIVEAMNDRQCWTKNQQKTNTKSENVAPLLAFVKKQAKPNYQEYKQNGKKEQRKQKNSQNSQNIESPQQEDSNNRCQIKLKKGLAEQDVGNDEKDKEDLKKISLSSGKQNDQNSTNKAMQSLNKSISLGRNKIKSLFGFKSSASKKSKEINSKQ